MPTTLVFRIEQPQKLSGINMGIRMRILFLRAESDGKVAVMLLFALPQSSLAGFVVSIGVTVRAAVL